jgi:spore maturation protein CgeB
MRFLIISSDYPAFLKWFYGQNPGLEMESYENQERARADSLFALADFYSSNLRQLGHEAWEISANNEFMQKAWVQQHDCKVKLDRRWEFRLRRGVVPWVSRVSEDRWIYDILAAQIKHYKPDVLVNYDMRLSGRFFCEMKPHVRLMVGGHGTDLPQGQDFGAYDLVLSPVDNLVDRFRQLGLRSELHRFAFEPSVLERLDRSQRSIPVSFVGTLFSVHAARIRWLEYLCQRFPVRVWTPSIRSLPAHSSIVHHCVSSAWGAEMFEILYKSHISLNNHIDVAEAYAGNLRLFEATGVGSLLITDRKKNLPEMFEPGKEVLAYETPEECLEMIQYYLEHDEDRKTIARAGQQRTLRDHTYYKRVQELLGIVAALL